MRILITPEELVEYGVWDYYVTYVLKDASLAQENLKNNVEFELKEDDALVIKLINTLPTFNLIHKFNSHLVYILSINSRAHENEMLIKLSSIKSAIDNFLNKYPSYWEPRADYAKGLKDAIEYISELRSKIEELPTKTIVLGLNTNIMVSANAINKLLSFKHY